MIAGYRDNETRRLCEDESYMKSKFPPSAVINLQQLLYRLNSCDKFEYFEKTIWIRNKYRVHKLKGKKKDLYSLSFSNKCRMTVKVYVKIEKDEITIWEVSSNHYGD